MPIQTLLNVSKLDGLGPVDNRPSTNKLHHFVKKKKKKKMWHVTCDMWHVTRDLWYYEDLEEKADSLT